MSCTDTKRTAQNSEVQRLAVQRKGRAAKVPERRCRGSVGGKGARQERAAQRRELEQHVRVELTGEGALAAKPVHEVHSVERCKEVLTATELQTQVGKCNLTGQPSLADRKIDRHSSRGLLLSYDRIAC